MLYKRLKADIVSLELDIQEVHNGSGIRDLSYSERFKPHLKRI